MLGNWLRLLACAALFAVAAPAAKKPARTPTPASAPPAVSEKAAPYTYPAPVKGHFREVNTGDFDLTDGIAWRASGGEGTVVYVTAKAIASPVLARSPCPMTQARALTALRNSGYVELTLDASGTSRYFGSGMPFGGSGREEEAGGRSWTSSLKRAGGRATGRVDHENNGAFEFNLEALTPKFPEVSESDQMQGRRGPESAPVPSERAVTAAYKTLREAAFRKDLRSLLAAQGFEERQIAAIRGLEGIDADLAVFSDRFLDPGNTGEFQAGPGYASVGAEGRSSKDAKFINYYWFAPCGDRLVLVSISENPQ